MNKVLFPSTFAHHYDTVPRALRRHYYHLVQRRGLHNNPEKDKPSSFFDSHFREGDVNKEVRESIKKQKEMDEKAHQQDSFCMYSKVH